MSYGTADTMPTPVLHKTFFSNPTPMMNQMREEPHKLGIGSTGSGDGYGMAALEGMVAALEVSPFHLYAIPYNSGTISCKTLSKGESSRKL